MAGARRLAYPDPPSPEALDLDWEWWEFSPNSLEGASLRKVREHGG